SQLETSSFNAYAQSLAADADVSVRTPNDAGGVVLAAGTSLSLLGTGRFGGGPGGLLGNLDITASRLAVLGSGISAPDASYIVLDAAALDAFGAGSVLLGGVRTPGVTSGATTGTGIAVSASDIYVSTGGRAWSGPEILLAATGSVTVAAGSTLQAQGSSTVDTSPLILDGTGGAFLRLSIGDRVPLLRPGATVGAPGSLSVGAATLATSGSLSLDGTQGITLSPDANLSDRQLDLASARINLGAVPAGTPGLTLGTDALARLAGGSDLLLRGYESIQLYGSVNLAGGDGGRFKTLTLDTGLLQGQLAAGDVARLSASTLELRNSGA